ncbi:hypothetical protein BaRGS_00024915 [Batillaria attramentaria]|uniref:Uncharacterized protein n=1 Tax=Batillaria attramentaria TaxID=370345 RepID=A0ABD0K9Q0_9CAEN
MKQLTDSLARSTIWSTNPGQSSRKNHNTLGIQAETCPRKLQRRSSGKKGSKKPRKVISVPSGVGSLRKHFHLVEKPRSVSKSMSQTITLSGNSAEGEEEEGAVGGAKVTQASRDEILKQLGFMLEKLDTMSIDQRAMSKELEKVPGTVLDLHHENAQLKKDVQKF